MVKRFCVAFVFVCSSLPFAAFVSPSLYSQSTLLSTEKLAQKAEVVALGKVTSLTSEWNETHTMIRTRVTVSVDQFLKGSSDAAALTVYIPGGEVDGVGEVYSHSPKFSREEQVVVFARKDKDGRFGVAGGSAGKYTVEKDAVTGKMVVAGASTLDAFAAKVKSAMKAQDLK